MAGYASSVLVLTAAIFLLRLFGQGMMTHMALTATGRWFVAERGRAVSLVVLGHQGGEATLPLIISVITIGYGYQAGWFAGALALVLIGLPFAFWAYRVPREPHAQNLDIEKPQKLVRSWTRREVVRDPVFWVLLTGVLAPAFIGTTIFYHQNYLAELNDWPPQLFAVSLLVLALTTVGCALVTGSLIDRFGARVVLPYFLFPLGACCFSLALSGPAFTIFIVMIFLGISYGISATLFGSLWPEIYGTTHLGSIRALTVSASVLSTAAGPGLTGTLIDRGIDLPTQMNYLGVYCVLVAAAMAVASIFLRRRNRSSGDARSVV